MMSDDDEDIGNESGEKSENVLDFIHKNYPEYRVKLARNMMRRRGKKYNYQERSRKKKGQREKPGQ